MKKSELKLTGDTYRLTPTHWGETNIMVDEDEVSAMIAEIFDESADADEDENDSPDYVDIATDNEGNFYVINENLYRACENPDDAKYGAASVYGEGWETFDDEDN